MSEAEGVAMAVDFLSRLEQFTGRLAAPMSALPGTPEQVAEALFHYRTPAVRGPLDDENRRRLEVTRLALSDLQLFVADDVAAAVEEATADPTWGPTDGTPPAEAIRAIMRRQEAVRLLTLEDPDVIARRDASVDSEIRIGDVACIYYELRSDSDRQSAAGLSMLAWPIAAPIGGIVGAIGAGGGPAAVAATVALGLGGLFIAPYWGAMVVRVWLAIARLGASTQSARGHAAVVAVGRLVTFALIFVVPLLAGLLLAIRVARLEAL